MKQRTFSAIAFEVALILAAVGCAAELPEEAGQVGPGGSKPGAVKPGSKPVASCTGQIVGGKHNGRPADRDQSGVAWLGAHTAFRGTTFVGDTFVGAGEQSLFKVEVAGAMPMVTRFAGEPHDDSAGALVAGPCAQARFTSIFDVVTAPDGSLLVADRGANSVLRVVDPLGENCRVEFLTGFQANQPRFPLGEFVFGDGDGPARTATFSGVVHLATLPDGTVVVGEHFNQNAGRIRKVAPDANRTVTTLMPKNGDFITMGLASAYGKIYVLGAESIRVTLKEINPDTGATRNVFAEDASYFGGGTSDSLTVGDMIFDGKSLVAWVNTKIFRIDSSGNVAWLAGSGKRHEFSTDYDLDSAHPGDQLELPVSTQYTQAANAAWLAAAPNGDLYISQYLSTNFTTKLSCR